MLKKSLRSTLDRYPEGELSDTDALFHLQFRIDETVFFRNPEVRHAVEKNGDYQFKAENTRVLAMPIKHAGLILVGPGDAMPSLEQLAFNASQKSVQYAFIGVVLKCYPLVGLIRVDHKVTIRIQHQALWCGSSFIWCEVAAMLTHSYVTTLNAQPTSVKATANTEA